MYTYIYVYLCIYIYMAVSRLFMYTKREGVHRATITERVLISDSVRLPAGEQSDNFGILRLNDRKS